MSVSRLKRALLGTFVGAVTGPLLSGISGAILLGLIWLLQGASDQLSWVVIFGILVAPIGTSVGVIIGLIIGGFGHWFQSFINAGSFGGAVGAIIGVMTAPFLFAGGHELSPAVVAIISLALTGLTVAVGVKELQRRLRSQPAKST